jgi:hypothetical protein
MLDLSDYELVWPPDLFAAEVERILGRPGLGQEAVDLLLREAFRDENAAVDISALTVTTFGAPSGPRSLADHVRELAAAAHSIKRSSAPRPYWPQRHGKEVPAAHLDASGARHGFANLINDLDEHGYLEQTFPRSCVDSLHEERDPRWNWRNDSESQRCGRFGQTPGTTARSSG